MNKRRFIRRMLRPSLVLIYLLVITLTIVLCNYAFGGLDAALLQVKADNMAYDMSLFEDINDKDLSKLEIEVFEETKEVEGQQEFVRYFTSLQYVQEGIAANKKKPVAEQVEEAELKKQLEAEFKAKDLTKVTFAEFVDKKTSDMTESDAEQAFYAAYSLLPGDRIADNANYIMYFNIISTIATVYEKEFDEFGNELKVEQLKRYYTTAVPGSNAKAANVEVSYLDEEKGSVVNDSINSVAGSTNYMNTLTNEFEKHYSLRFTDKGVQIAYQIGKFDAGEAYFPQYIYATMYKPEKGAFINRKGEFDEMAYDEHVAKWTEYMATLGLEDAMEASYEEINAALSQTFEELFRGNCFVYTNNKLVGDKMVMTYAGSMNVYTREAFEYIKGLIDSGEISGEYNEDHVENGTAYDSKTRNLYWKISKLDASFFEEGEGVYFNCPDSPLSINLKLIGDAYKNFANESTYKLTEALGDIKYPHYEVQDIRGVVQLQIYNLLYKEFHYYDNVFDYKFYDRNGNPLMQGGMFEFDEDGNKVYENGVAKITYMTLEKASDFNSSFQVESSSSLPIFGLVLDFTLDAKGLDVTLLGDSLVDASTALNGKDVAIDDIGNTIGTYNKRYSYMGVKILPYMNYVEVVDEANKETGMIVIPDGSGALINFNNGKSNMLATALNTSYYGSDMTYTSTFQEEETMDLMLGMYGFIYTTETNPRGVLAILEKGGNQVSLYANTTDYVSNAYFSCKVRESKDIRIGNSVTSTPFTKWSYNLCDTDFKFKYVFLGEDEADYISLANKYREYLVERDGIVAKDETKDTVVDLNFLGSFEKYALFLGFKYKTPDALTTFEQATEIINELSTGVNVNGSTLKVNEFNVSYTGWTNEEMQYQVGGGIGVSSKLGGRSGMQEFAQFLDSRGYGFYPEMYVTTTLEYDLSFGNLKYTTRNIANETAVRYQFDLATQRVNKKVAATYVIRPEYYAPLAENFLNKTAKLNITSDNANDKRNGYYLVDLGNLTANHYGKNEEVYGEATIQYQKDALAKIAGENNDVKIKLKAPYDYAIKYADFITDVPMTSTQKQIYDEMIPLYQLVISGLVDYTVETINGTGSKGANWYFAKAIETGSNLSFQISYQNPTILLDTDYTYYYQSYYNNWRDNIVTMASEIDDLGIHEGKLVYHKNIAKNIAHVKYLLNNGTYVELYVNTTVNDYNYNGTVIPAYGYVKVA